MDARVLDFAGDWQGAEAAEADSPVALGGPGGREAREAPEQGGERDARFHARDVHAGAGVIAVAEGDVAVGLARDVEALGVGELRRVAVGGADRERDEGARGEPPAAER